MQPPTNERWRGEEKEELDPWQPRDSGSREEENYDSDSKGSQLLAVGDVFNILETASLGTFTQSRQRRQPSLLFPLSGYGTRPASGESLPPEAEVQVRDKQKGPKGKSLAVSKLPAVLAGDTLTAKVCVSVNTFLTASTSSQLLLTHLVRPDCREPQKHTPSARHNLASVAPAL